MSILRSLAAAALSIGLIPAVAAQSRRRSEMTLAEEQQRAARRAAYYRASAAARAQADEIAAWNEAVDAKKREKQPTSRRDQRRLVGRAIAYRRTKDAPRGDHRGSGA